jgi:hypothetical protein
VPKDVRGRQPGCLEHPTPSARPFGIAQAESGRAVYEFGGGDDRTTVRAEMEDEAFEAARTEGRAMTLEQAIEYALESQTD